MLVGEIRAILEDSKQRYGLPRIHAELQAQGHHVSRQTVAKLMKRRGIHPPRRKRRMPVTTDSQHSFAIAPTLLNRNFKIMVPDTVWLADISYIPPDEGWLSLAAVKDLATLEIVGWSMSERLKSTLCEDALNPLIDCCAINCRAANGDRQPTPRTGADHPHRSWRAICLRQLQEITQTSSHHITASMSRKGTCLDNAPMESFFRSLKTEMVHLTRFQTRQAAKAVWTCTCSVPVFCEQCSP